MSHTLTLRIPDDLSSRLDRLAELTARPKSFYVRTLIEDHIAELEYVAGLDAHAEALLGGKAAAAPLAGLAAELGFDLEELRVEGRAELGL